MIQLEIDTKQLIQEIDSKIAGVKEMTSSSVLGELSKAVYSLTSEKFLTAVDNYARRNPKAMHHVYEWGKIGDSKFRLFVLERSVVLGGNLTISSRFLPSKMPVPINPELLNPGRTGKAVSRKSIFANKAEVMESGKMVSFTAKRVLAFMGNDGIAFIKPGTTVNIAHPGGIKTTNAFSSFMLDWYTRNGNKVIDSSGFYDKLESEVVSALEVKGAGAKAVREAVIRAVNSIGGIV